MQFHVLRSIFRIIIQRLNEYWLCTFSILLNIHTLRHNIRITRPISNGIMKKLKLKKNRRNRHEIEISYSHTWNSEIGKTQHAISWAIKRQIRFEWSKFARFFDFIDFVEFKIAHFFETNIESTLNSTHGRKKNETVSSAKVSTRTVNHVEHSFQLWNWILDYCWISSQTCFTANKKKERLYIMRRSVPKRLI